MNRINGMQKLFSASDIIEAQLLKRLLITSGIEACIKNEDLQSGLGELPFVEMWPEVWVIEPSDWDSAREILSDFLKRGTESDWVCAHCKEVNPGTFETCWACETGPSFGEDEFMA